MRGKKKGGKQEGKKKKEKGKERKEITVGPYSRQLPLLAAVCRVVSTAWSLLHHVVLILRTKGCVSTPGCRRAHLQKLLARHR